jgi:8-oxo-dGTP pyrophosphatase MutT (NUDIX family)
MDKKIGIVRCAIFRKIHGDFQVLLCERADNQRWEFPGGGINLDETGEPVETPYEAIIREVWEETSLKVQEYNLRFVTSLPHPLGPEINPHYVRFYATAVYTGTATPDNYEVSECVWVPVSDIGSLPITSLTKYLLTTVPMFSKYLTKQVV